LFSGSWVDGILGASGILIRCGEHRYAAAASDHPTCDKAGGSVTDEAGMLWGCHWRLARQCMPEKQKTPASA